MSTMSKHNRFKNEAQDASRHDQQHSSHPNKIKHAPEHEKSKLEPHSDKKK